MIANDDRQMTGDEGVSETPDSSPTNAAGMPTRCALCQMPIVTTDGLIVRDRGLVCFGCLGEVETALAEYRSLNGAAGSAGSGGSGVQ